MNSTFFIVNFSLLPIMPEINYKWDSVSALDRVKKFTKSEISPGKSYWKAFMLYDLNNLDNFLSYEMLFADVFKNKLYAIPQAIDSMINYLAIPENRKEFSRKELKALDRLLQDYNTQITFMFPKPVGNPDDIIFG